MVKRTDKPDKLTTEQRERLLAAGERLLRLGWEPASFIEKLADGEERLAQHLDSPMGAPTEKLAAAVRRLPGVWASPSVLSTIAVLRTEIGFEGDSAAESRTDLPFLEREDLARWFKARAKVRKDELRTIADALWDVRAKPAAALTRAERATQRALAFLVEEHALIQSGLTRAGARTLLAPKYGFRPREQKETKGPRGLTTVSGARGGNTTVAESIARWLSRHPEARARLNRRLATGER